MLISSFKALKRLVQNNFIDFFIAMSLKTIISETLFLWHEKPSCHNDVTCLIGLECCSVLNTKLLVNTGKMSEWLLGGGNANHIATSNYHQISKKTDLRNFINKLLNFSHSLKIPTLVAYWYHILQEINFKDNTSSMWLMTATIIVLKSYVLKIWKKFTRYPKHLTCGRIFCLLENIRFAH